MPAFDDDDDDDDASCQLLDVPASVEALEHAINSPC